MELEVEAEGCEWMRRRLQEKLQTQAGRLGGVFPPERARAKVTQPETVEKPMRGVVGDASRKDISIEPEDLPADWVVAKLGARK
jgi:hypothetical protein